MFEKLKSVFGRKKKNSAVAAESQPAPLPLPKASETPKGLTADEDIVAALAAAVALPPAPEVQSEAGTAGENEADAIARLLAEEPPRLKRGNPGGQEYVVRVTYNQKEWIESTYPTYVSEYRFAPYGRVMQVFVEKYMQYVEERVHSISNSAEIQSEAVQEVESEA